MDQIVFLGMGGTIAGQATSSHDSVGYTAGQVSIETLLGQVPGLVDALAGSSLHAEQVAQLDSKDINPADWVLLAQRIFHHLQREHVAGVVVTHGTDTLEETAYFLSRVLPSSIIGRKPVVLTCAMRPATALYPDGPGNLLHAVIVAKTLHVWGVMAVCAGQVHAGQHVRKVHPYRLDPFDSGEFGPLGCLEEGRLRLFRKGHDALPVDEQAAFALQPSLSFLSSLPQASWPWVEIVTSHAGASGRMVHALLTASKGSPSPLRGIIVAGTGNGTVHHELKGALQVAQEQGVRVIRTTRCVSGRLVLPTLDASQLADQSVEGFETSMLTPVKARIALMLELLA